MKILFISLLLLCSYWATANAGSQAGFTELIAQSKQHYGFSGAVLVVKNGKPIFTATQGYADDVKLQPVTLLTRFNIGSIQKDLTALLVLQAYDDGLLALADTLDKYSLATSDPKSNKITIQQLLEHRSGFADVFTAEYRNNPSQFTNIADKLQLLRHQPLLFEPGSERKYSNYGYIVLGAVLEKVTKQDYWTLLENKVLAPARTALATKQSGHDFVALPYHFNYAGKRLLVDPSMLEHKTPDGGGELTVYELYAVYQQLFNQKKLLSDSSRQILKKLQQDQRQWLAFGGGVGVSTAVEIDFINDLWVIVLANTDRLVAEALSSRLRSLALSGQYAKVQLPATLFAYQQYQQLGDKLFATQFETVYKNAGYQTFFGKTITDLARELIADGKAEDSIYFFSYLTNKFPEHAAVYDGLAYGYFSAGRYVDAKVAFAKAKALNPDYVSQFNAGNYEAKYQ
jgi:CubicO group peptidase (beta-lactamase class C family)